MLIHIENYSNRESKYFHVYSIKCQLCSEDLFPTFVLLPSFVQLWFFSAAYFLLVLPNRRPPSQVLGGSCLQRIFTCFVCLVCSRDVDSPFTFRERAAVEEWLCSNNSFHVMRDHPNHVDPILAGMWGYRPRLNENSTIFFLRKLTDIDILKKYNASKDQDFLFNEIWPIFEATMLIHDSYHCMQHGHRTRPFPTRRPPIDIQNAFVGCIKPCLPITHPLKPCPVECRPVHHKDWLYC